MTEKSGEAGNKRRRRAEIARLVGEYGGSGQSVREFCQSRGLALSTLQRHLKKQRERGGANPGANRLMAVELGGGKLAEARTGGWDLAVVLEGGWRIEVQAGFDEATLRRLMKLLVRE